MGEEAEAIFFTMLVVLLTIAIYNTFLKPYTPNSIRNVIGL